MEKSVLDTLIATLEANKEKITRAREDARATRNDKALYELTVITRTLNATLLAILQSMAAGEKP
jgi:hypothetical protein